ncbi:hypothetical protein BH20ACI2_BH20ACI2_12730 [soil metagenome]
MRAFRYGSLALFAAIAFSSVSAASAQNPRNIPKPLATPPRVLTAAEIISRADELFDRPIVQTAEDRDVNAAAENAEINDLKERIKKLEAGRGIETSAAKKADPDEVQKRMLLNLDIVTRAEQRSDSLRKQLFEMIEKENTVRSRLEQLQFEMRPEMIERTLQLAGSMKPEEIRESRRKSLAAERDNLQALLTEIQSTRSSVSANLQRSEVLVEKLRAKLEKDIDDALLTPDK